MINEIRIGLQPESIILNRPARVSIFAGDQLVAQVIAKIEPKQGADGKFYPCVVLEKE